MKFAVLVSSLAFAASALAAQQPPARPRPLPAPRPMPAPSPDLWDLAPNISLNLDQNLQMDLQSRLGDLQLRSQDIAERAQEQAQRALARLDVGRLRNFASSEALDAMRNFDRSGMGDAFAGEAFAHTPRAPWAQGDPADSLYRAAREAFNRGDWRQSSDLFSQVVHKYPNSAYVADCAYFEAFSRYRIGTTDELHQALALLADQNGPATRSSRKADAAALAARIRGALAARGDAQAAAQIAREAQKNGGCDREDMSVRAEALNALGQMDPAAATPLLRRVLARTDSCSTQLKRSALFMLVRQGDTVATNTLISVATDEKEDPGLRTDAITFLARMPGEQALSTIESLVKSSTDDRVQRAAILALAQNDSPQARQAIRALIERSDVSESLRSDAIMFLGGNSASSDDAAYLRALYPKLPSERLKRAALMALARVGGSVNVQFLLAVARNQSESSEVRGAAIEAVGRLSDVPVSDLTGLYDAADSRNLRVQIIAALGQRNDSAATDKLMDVAKNGTDPSVRRFAIDALSRRRDDPRVTKFLADLVGR
ncbi:MAG: HEAT repeat domain-containing protein [Gemmatimonadota bacterium]|nr:HEAT repeat domain-containing protein [Gemmatimonadota bacterium]